jgi:hypothetical protein
MGNHGQHRFNFKNRKQQDLVFQICSSDENILRPIEEQIMLRGNMETTIELEVFP